MSEAPLSIALHPSAWPLARRSALLASVRGGRVPGALLYQSLAQAQRWLAYHAAWSPSRIDAELQAVYDEAFAALAEALPDAGSVLLLGVGSGGGRKDATLLGHLARVAPKRALHYVPLDASTPLAAEAALHVRASAPGVALHPLVADVEAAPPLEGWLDECAPGTVRVVSCLGMLPNQDARAFPSWLAGLLRPGDELVVSANLSPGGLTVDGPRILEQYDNPPARAWYRGALFELGLAATAYALDVSARPLADAAALGLDGESAWQVSVQAVLREGTDLALHDETLHFPVGARLEVFHSQRFTADAAQHVLERASLRSERHWVGAGGEEGVFLCRRD